MPIFDPAIFDPAIFDGGAPAFTADAIFRRTTSSSFVADSIIRRATEAALVGDAILRKTAAAALTADAVLRQTASGSFTADAVIGTGGAVVEGSLTADAVVSRTISSSLAADAILWVTRAGSLVVDSVVRRSASGSFTADAILALHFSADAVLKKTQAASFTAKAWIYAPRADPGGPGEPGETPLVSILVDGEDITNDVILSDATFTMLVNGAIGQFRFRVRDDAHVRSFVSGAEVTLDIDGKRKFGGFLTQPKRMFAFPVEDTTDPDHPSRFHVLEGVDYNILLTKRVVYDKADPASVGLRSWPAGSHDDVVIKYVFDNYTDLAADGVTYQGVTHIASPNPDKVGVVGSGGLRFVDAMREINRLISGVFYIDPFKDLNYVDVDTPDAAYGLSDRPEAGEVGYRELIQSENGTGLVNDAMVWGVGMGSARVAFSRKQDAASIAAHQRWQFGEYTTSLFRQSSVDLRASTIVDGTPQSKRGGKDDQESWSLVSYESTFTVGQKVAIESEVFGKSDVVPIRRMTITFPTKRSPRYEMVLSHEIDEPWNLFEFYFPPFPPFPGFGTIDIPPFDLPSPCSEENHFGAQGCQEVIDGFNDRTLPPSTATDAWGESPTGPEWYTNPGGRWSVHDGEGWFERAADDPNSPCGSIVLLSVLNNVPLLTALNEQEVLLYGEFYLPGVIDVVEDAVEGAGINGGILTIRIKDATKVVGGLCLIHTGSVTEDPAYMIDVGHTDATGGGDNPNDATLINWTPGWWHWGLYFNRLTGLIEFGVQQGSRPSRPFSSSIVGDPTKIPQTFVELELWWTGPKVSYVGGAVTTPVDPRIAFDNIEVDGCIVVLAQYDCRDGDDMTFVRTVEGTSQNTGGASTSAFFGNIGTNDATDWLVASVRLFAASGVTCDTPAGWSAHPDNGHAMVTETTTTLWMFYKLSSGDPNEDVTFTFSGPTKYSANVESLRGADGTVGGFAKSSSSGTVINLGVISAPVNQHLALFGCGAIDTFAILNKDAGVDVFTATTMPSPEGPNLRLLTGYADYDFPSQYIEAHDISGTLTAAASMIGLTIGFTQGAGCLALDCIGALLEGPDRSDQTGTGSQTVFQLPVAFVAGTTRVYVEGFFQRPGIEYTESAALGQITFVTAPALGAAITVFYDANGSL
jgi:hypothetical protein